MSQRWSQFRELYMSADRRVLGILRIAHGLVLLYEIIRRFRIIELYYSNDGILSNHYLLFQPQDRPQLSFLTAFSSTGEVRAAFCGIAVVFTLYTLGLFTRVMQVLAFVCLTALNSRNLFAEDGGVSTLIAIATWSVFLPLGDRFSLDAVLREARLPTVRARVALRSRLTKPVVSVAVLALTLQITAIYLLNAVQKTGPSWRSGDAVHYVLWQGRISTAFAWWLAHHEPHWLTFIMTKGTIFVECAIPLFILYPYSRWTRAVAFGLSLMLHGGIALMMTLGPFSYAMMALVSSCLPPEALDWIAAHAPVALGRRLRRLQAAAVRWTSPRVERSPLPSARRPLSWHELREGAVLVLLVALSTEITRSNPFFKIKLPQPDWLHAAIFYPRMTQRWLMFAPEAPKDDGMTVIDAVNVKGEHIDPFTGKPPDFDVLDKGPVPHPMEVADYLYQVHFDFNKPYTRELTRYLEHWHEHGGRGPDDRLVSYEAWWLNRDSPRPGSLEPGPTEKASFARARFKH